MTEVWTVVSRLNDGLAEAPAVEINGDALLLLDAVLEELDTIPVGGTIEIKRLA